MDLSVLVTTYNHGRYIAQALDSILMQELPFEWEVLVGEDDSSDGTREIVRRYAERHPQRIRAFLHEYPHGYVHVNGHSNFVNSLENVRGRYVALIDGDDYWISPDKLRRQVEFLEYNPTYSGCFHNVMQIREGHPDVPCFSGPQPARLDVRDLASAGRNLVPSCAVVFRSGLFGALPEWHGDVQCGDWALHLLNAEHGPFGYIDEILGAYRVHDRGAWSGMRIVDQLKAAIAGAQVLDRRFEYRYHHEFARSIYRWRVGLAATAAGQHRFGAAAAHLARAAVGSPRHFWDQASTAVSRRAMHALRRASGISEISRQDQPMSGVSQ